MKKILLFLTLIPFIGYSQWTQLGQNINGSVLNDNAGKGVTLSSDGSVIAVATPGDDTNGSSAGQVKVYENASGTWVQLGQSINGEAAGDNLGSTSYGGYYTTAIALSSSGSIIAIGSLQNSGTAGHVRIFEFNSGVWTQIGQDIDGAAVNLMSGFSIDLNADGSIVAIGELLGNKVKVFKNVSGSWVQRGTDIIAEAASNQFGYAVDLSSDGTVLAVGAPKNDGGGTDAGHVRVYKYLEGADRVQGRVLPPTWTQIGQDIDGEAAGDESGSALSLNSSGNIIAIGARLNTNNGAGASSGHVRVYMNNAGTWTQVGSDIDSVAQGDEFGISVDLSSNGNIVAIGARLSDGPGGFLNSRGQVRVFENLSNVWTQVNSDINGVEVGEEFGTTVAINGAGTILIAGAPMNSSVALRSGRVKVYQNSTILSINDLEKSLFSLYPNPVNDSFKIQTDEIINSVSIYSINGNKVKEFKNSLEHYSLKNLSNGMYFVKIKSDKGTITKKVIKQ